MHRYLEACKIITMCLFMKVGVDPYRSCYDIDPQLWLERVQYFHSFTKHEYMLHALALSGENLILVNANSDCTCVFPQRIQMGGGGQGVRSPLKNNKI